MTLDELFRLYDKIQKEEEELKKTKDMVKDQIVTLMGAAEIASYRTSDGIEGKLVKRTNIKYLDEVGIMDYLKMRGMSQFIKSSIDTTNLNKQLKSSNLLKEGLSGKYQEVESLALSVKSN